MASCSEPESDDAVINMPDTSGENRRSSVFFNIVRQKEEQTLDRRGSVSGRRVSTFSRRISIFSRRFSVFSKRFSIFSKFSDFANQSRRPSSLFSKLSESQQESDKACSSYNMCLIRIVVLGVLSVLVVILYKVCTRIIVHRNSSS